MSYVFIFSTSMKQLDQTLIVICFIVSFFSCDEKSPESHGVTAKQIEGFWTSEKVLFDYSACKPVEVSPSEGPVLSAPQNRSWLVTTDSIWVFQYPYTFSNKWNYYIKSDSLFLGVRLQTNLNFCLVSVSG